MVCQEVGFNSSSVSQSEYFWETWRMGRAKMAGLSISSVYF